MLTWTVLMLLLLLMDLVFPMDMSDAEAAGLPVQGVQWGPIVVQLSLIHI